MRHLIVDTYIFELVWHLLISDSAHGLFGHAASLVCNRLMASWKMDLNNALAAIEVLSSLAKVRLNNPNLLMCKRTVNWISEFIVYQCSRPAPAHSKDLHSMIVAAFHCLTLWLVEHEYLMQDKECLHCVLEVVELGISGSKSQVSSHTYVFFFIFYAVYTLCYVTQGSL